MMVLERPPPPPLTMLGRATACCQARGASGVGLARRLCGRTQRPPDFVYPAAKHGLVISTRIAKLYRRPPAHLWRPELRV